MGLGWYKTSSLYLRILFRFITGGYEVINKDRVPMDGSLIVASNHTSYLDPMVVGSILGRPLSYMARRSLFKNRFFSFVIRQHFAFPLDREGDSRAALRSFTNRLKTGAAVLIFPEGTRSPNGRLQPFKPGVGMIAVRSNVPVLPVYLWGSYQAWPKGKAYPKRHKLVLFVGEQIYPAECESPSEKKHEIERVAHDVERSIQNMEIEADTSFGEI